jgi:glc operon protein GlcG
MHRLMMMVGAVCASLMLSASVFAQVPPDPNNPNEKLPDKLSPPPYGTPINLETAKKVANAAFADATKRGWNAFCITVVGPSGDLVYFEKMDNCQYASITISQNKARAAARFRRPTLVFERLMGKGAFFAYLPTLGDAFTGSRGGNPLLVGGKVIGAIGVSGGTGAQDDAVSQAGAKSVQ